MTAFSHTLTNTHTNIHRDPQTETKRVLFTTSAEKDEQWVPVCVHFPPGTGKEAEKGAKSILNDCNIRE